MHDLLPPEVERWQTVETVFREVLDDFGYREVRTPALEKAEVFTHAVGDETDIVQKQMYFVQSQDDERMVLRPEGTAGFMRAVVEHQLHQNLYPQRYYYLLPMFRYERPQKGRLRQFHQVGAELILEPSPEADAELIILMDTLLRRVGLQSFEVRINSVGCAETCRPRYRDALQAYFRPRLDALCEQCRARFERAPLRILDCKKESCQAIAAGAPVITQYLCGDCAAHHEAVSRSLSACNIPFVQDPRIVRGLDYYTRTAWELVTDKLGAQSALGGGGRYDGLSERYGAKAFPSVGFGIGIERVVLLMEQESTLKVPERNPTLYIAALGASALQALLPVSMAMRRSGIKVEMNYDTAKSLKSLLKQANRVAAEWALLCGDEELKSRHVLLKHMATGTQETVSIDSLEAELKRKFHAA